MFLDFWSHAGFASSFHVWPICGNTGTHVRSFVCGITHPCLQILLGLDCTAGTYSDDDDDDDDDDLALAYFPEIWPVVTCHYTGYSTINVPVEESKQNDSRTAVVVPVRKGSGTIAACGTPSRIVAMG